MIRFRCISQKKLGTYAHDRWERGGGCAHLHGWPRHQSPLFLEQNTIPRIDFKFSGGTVLAHDQMKYDDYRLYVC